MKIVEVTDKHIKFDNGNKITFQHEPDCCEENYADFSIINPNVINFDADFPEELEFNFFDGMGFLFLAIPNRMDIIALILKSGIMTSALFTDHVTKLYIRR